MINISAKFDQEIHNGSVFIVFKSLLPYMPIVTLTLAKFDQEVHNSLVTIVFTSVLPYKCQLLP